MILRVATVSAAIALAALAGCDRGEGPSPGSTAGPRPTGAAKQGGRGAPYTRLEECGAGEVCWFDQAGCGADARGACGPQDPPCVVSYPFCGCAGHTYYGCTRPPAAWSRKGACGDGGS